jgi:hypothetical protein
MYTYRICSVCVCVYIFSTGPNVHWWYSHTLYRIRLSIARKYTVLNGIFVLDLHDIFQECNPEVKWDLPLFHTGISSCWFTGSRFPLLQGPAVHISCPISRNLQSRSQGVRRYHMRGCYLSLLTWGGGGGGGSFLLPTNGAAYKLKEFYCIWYWILHRTK